MVPEQKYDVIHYIREAYLKPYHPGQYGRVDPAYLARLPKGTSRGVEPVEIQPWVTMDYGPSLMATYEISNGDGSNIVNKGIAIRLDSGPGGVSRGRAWALYVPESGRSSGPSTMARTTTTTNDRSRSRPPASRPTGTPSFSRSPTSGRPGAWRSCTASGAGEARRWTG
jgi:hypothetical protein